MQCNRCGSREYFKNGKTNGVQRYKCKGCGKYFSAQPRKFSFADKERALDMYLNNVGVRKIARFIGASPALIVRWIQGFGEQLSHQLQRAGNQCNETVPDVIEMDKIYSFVQKNSNERLYGLLIVEEKVVLLRMSSEKASVQP